MLGEYVLLWQVQLGQNDKRLRQGDMEDRAGTAVRGIMYDKRYTPRFIQMQRRTIKKGYRFLQRYARRADRAFL